LDNIFVKIFWRSLKYADIYLRDNRSVGELNVGLVEHFAPYSCERFHESPGYQTPDTIYFGNFIEQRIEKAV
jgi:putative transposase